MRTLSVITTIAKKELNAYFKSPLAYIVLVITISVFNVFFFVIIDENREATLRDMFKLMEFMFVFIVPIFTMKIFAEEKRSGTIEFLMTSPIKESSIVLGKYLGSVCFFTLLILVTLVYYGIIEAFADPDRLVIGVGYFGLWLEGAFFIAIGVLMSSLTRSQMIAALSSYAIILLLYFLISFIKYFDPKTQEIIRYISVWTHAQNFAAGLILLSDIVYYLTGIIFCLYVTRLSLNNRLWK